MTRYDLHLFLAGACLGLALSALAGGRLLSSGVGILISITNLLVWRYAR
jgi:hypothetical protein